MNRIARRITAFDESTEQFIQQCEDSRKFSKRQMQEIRDGFKQGLTMEQVRFYADPKFSAAQMREIYWGFEDGLTMEQVKFYAQPDKFNESQMREMRRGFKNSLTMEEVELYAKPELHSTQMQQIRYDIHDGMSIEEVKEEYDLY